MQRIKKAVILCGGLATRFLPISKSVCKEMLPIINRPIIDLIVTELKEAGIEEVLIVVRRGKEILENYFDRNVEIEERLALTGKNDLLELAQRPQNILRVSFIRQLDASGTAQATYMAKEFAGGEPFLMMFGDELLFNKTSGTKQLLAAYDECYEEGGSLLAVKTVAKSEVSSYGIINPCTLFKSESGLIKVFDMVEKPKPEDAPSNLCYIGPAILTPEIFEEIEKLERPTESWKEVVLTCAYRKLAQRGKLFAAKINGTRFDVGSHSGLIKANVYAALKDKNYKDDMIEFLSNLGYDKE